MKEEITKLEELNKFIGSYYKPYLSKTILEDDLKGFLGNLEDYIKKYKTKGGNEEYYKNEFNRFLESIFNKNGNSISINTHDKIDSSIKKDDKIRVLIEFKRPSNKSEMINPSDLNKKALHETLWYFYNPKYDHTFVTYLIISNGDDVFIFDSKKFGNKAIKDLCINFKDGSTSLGGTNELYEKIGEIIEAEGISNIIGNYCYFSIEELSSNLEKAKDYLENKENGADQTFPKLVALYKIFHPDFLLREYKVEDSNTLNSKFYNELLYILGLKEVKEKNGSKKLIIQLTKEIGFLASEIDYKLSDYSEREDATFQLIISWLNRILFLKLFEGQLVSFNDNKDMKFLTSEKIKDWNNLDNLFFKIVGKPIKERRKRDFDFIPYLNSSLFEESEIEIKTRITISHIDNDNEIPLFDGSILNDNPNYKGFSNKKVNTLKYLLDFLDAYDFGAEEHNHGLRKENKDIINSAVLGLIFEKLNGYKDGSVYTPGHITEFMAKESIEKAVLDKFNTVLSDCNVDSIEKLSNFLYRNEKDCEEHNRIFNSITVCDPAVGSGHFLVSVLYRLIALKSELGLLTYNGKLLRADISVENDILTVIDQYGENYHYKRNSLEEQQNIQKSIFEEKRNIIENMLFGVDINPNSVEICRLRLWIELLKHTYYLDNNSNEMEVLPNIDINIKCGDSLLSKYPAEVGKSILEKVDKRNLSSQLENIKNYKNAVISYKKSYRKQEKDKVKENLKKVKESIYSSVQFDLFEKNTESENIYHNSIEWMIEFPEVLDDDGSFLGFDVIIGNPPYIQLQDNKGYLGSLYIKEKFKTFDKKGDIYALFYEKASKLVKLDGSVCLITSNKWMRASYGKVLRNFLVEHTNTMTLIDLGANIFDSVTVESNILMYQNSNTQQKFIDSYILDIKLKEIEKKALYDLFIQKKKPIQPFKKDDSWIIIDELEKKVKFQIEKVGVPLKDWDISINYGIKTGFDDAFLISTEKREEILRACEGFSEENFLKGKRVAGLNKTEYGRTKELIKPVLRGRDIKRYEANWEDLWIIATHNGYKDKSGRKIDKIDIELYLSIKNHLNQYLEQIQNRQDKGDTAYNLRNCAYYKDFEKEKVVWHELTDNNKFLIDNNFFTMAGTFILTGKNIKFLCSILNTKIIKWFFDKICTKSGQGTNAWKKYKVEELPIPNISQEQQKPFEMLVDYIQYTKEKKLESSLSEYLEAIINKMVLDLYFEDLSKKHQVYALEALSEIILQFEKKAINEKNIIDLVNHLKECKEYKEHQNKFLDIPEFSLISKS